MSSGFKALKPAISNLPNRQFQNCFNTMREVPFDGKRMTSTTLFDIFKINII